MCWYSSFIILCIIGHAAYCSHLISYFEVFFSGSFVANVLPLFIFIVLQSQYIVLEKKYSKAKKLLREFQQREQDLLHREEFYLQLLQEKDTEYNALVKTLKDRVSYCYVCQ